MTIQTPLAKALNFGSIDREDLAEVYYLARLLDTGLHTNGEIAVRWSLNPESPAHALLSHIKQLTDSGSHYALFELANEIEAHLNSEA